jgi:molybdopterin molybdotransferase
MLSYEDALKIVLERFEAVDLEVEKIDRCFCRVLAEDLDARLSIPAFNASKVDGYALSTKDYVWVNTGDELPEGFDRVIRVEEVVKKQGKLIFTRRPKRWENVSKRGEDIKEGDLILRRGTFLNNLKILAIKSCGIDEVRVYRRPKIAILVTGDEFARIPATNHLMISALLEGLCDVDTFLARDSTDEITPFFMRGGYDALITTGGTSKGKKDLMREIVGEIGEIIFHGSRIKPGRTAFFGEVNRTPVFCLPGKPPSCLSSFMLYVKPAIMKMLELNERWMVARIEEIERPDPDFTRFFLISYDGEEAKILREGFFKSLLKANGYLVLREGEGGKEVKIHPLSFCYE